MKVWITKYALTKGIFVDDSARLTVTGNCEIRRRMFPEYFHGKEWHISAEAADARAEEMRQAKIASHRKAIAKLEKMRFGVSE